MGLDLMVSTCRQRSDPWRAHLCVRLSDSAIQHMFRVTRVLHVLDPAKVTHCSVSSRSRHFLIEDAFKTRACRVKVKDLWSVKVTAVLQQLADISDAFISAWAWYLHVSVFETLSCFADSGCSVAPKK